MIKLLFKLISEILAHLAETEKVTPSESTKASAEEPNARASYEAFLLAEYDHIAKAHFTTVDTISTFFKNYLAIVGLPITILPVVFRATQGGPDTTLPWAHYPMLIPLAGLVLSFLGLCVF